MIPEVWELKRLEQIGEFKNGINKSKEDFGFGVPFVNLMDIFGNNVIDQKDYALVNATEKEVIDYKLLKGDVLFIRSSVKPEGVGLTALVNETLENTVYSGFIIRFRPFIELEHNFMRYCFYEEGFRRNLLSHSTISANTNINQESLKKLTLLLPPLPEQCKIAEILSNWDKAIALLEQLITAKRKLKQGLMQQLLTGKKRFKEFEGSERSIQKMNLPDNWFLSPISRFVLDCRGGAPLTPSDFSEEGFEVIPKKAIVYGGILNTSQEKPTYCTFEFANKNKKSIINNEYLITTLRDLVPTGPSIGLIVRYKEDKNYILAQGVYGFKISSLIEPDFIIALSNSSSFRKTLREISVGSTQIHIRNDDYFKIEIPIPPLPEQQKIASILSTADAEISNLEKQLAAYKQQKRGLMQQLLTGKKRVKIDEPQMQKV